MGTVISSKAKDGKKVLFEVLVDYEEALQLQGHMNHVHIFSEDGDGIDSNVSGRGKKEATKYFLIPREVRKGMQFDSKQKVKCYRSESKTKVIFSYVVDKKKE